METLLPFRVLMIKVVLQHLVFLIMEKFILNLHVFKEVVEVLNLQFGVLGIRLELL